MLLMHVSASLVQMWCSGAPPFEPAPCPRNTSSSPNPHLQSAALGTPRYYQTAGEDVAPREPPPQAAPSRSPPQDGGTALGHCWSWRAWELPPPFLSSSSYTSQTGIHRCTLGLGKPSP